MYTPTHNFNVRGIPVRTRTPRRFAVIAVRPEPFTNENGTYVAFAEVSRRTDNLETARAAKRRMLDNGYRMLGMTVVVVDLTTGEEL